MNFTEIEYVLFLLVAVLLWRNAKLDQRINQVIDDYNRYAHFLIKIGQGKGSVIKDGDGFVFKETK